MSTPEPEAFTRNPWSPEPSAYLGPESKDTAGSGHESAGADRAGLPELSLQQSGNVEKQIEQARDQDIQGPQLGTIWLELKQKLWPTFIMDHRNIQSLKVAGRTWIQLTVLLIITVASKPGPWIGQSAYLVNMAAAIQPSGGQSVGFYLFTTFNTMASLCWCFLHFVIAQAINWHLRGNLSQQDVYERIYASGECSRGDINCVSLALLDGRYLSLSTTVVVFFSVVFALTPLGWLSIKFAFLRASFLLALIAMYIISCQSIHFPWFAPWTLGGRSIIIPIGIAFALGLLLTVIMFPFSSNKKYIEVVMRAAQKSRATAADLFALQATLKPSDPHFSSILAKFPAEAVATMQPVNSLATDLLVAKYEFSYSRFDSADLAELGTRVRGIVNSTYSFKFFFLALQDRLSAINDTENIGAHKLHPQESDALPESMPKPPTFNRNRSNTFDYRSRKIKRPWRRSQHPVHYKNASGFERKRREQYVGAAVLGKGSILLFSASELDNLFTDLVEHYRPLLNAVQDIMEHAEQWLAEANRFRLWSLFWPSKFEEHVKRQKLLEESLYKSVEALDAVYHRIMDNGEFMHNTAIKRRYNKAQQDYFVTEDAFYGYLCKEHARFVRRLARWCQFLDRVQPRPKFNHRWALPHKDDLASRQKNYKEPDFDPPRDLLNYRPLTNVQARNADSTPPQNAFHRLAAIVFKYKKIWWSPEMKYSLKRSAVGLIPSILYATRPTLRFAYGNRILWASVMAGISMSARPGDSVYQFITRVMFSAIGGLAGLVGWYICAGNGSGNAVAFVVAFSVISIFVAFYIHFHGKPLPIASVVVGITVYLVGGTSWVNANMVIPGMEVTPGWSVFWHRIVCVIVGTALAFLATLFPHPQTGKKAVRVIHSSVLKSIGDMQSSLINFSMQRYDDARIRADPLKDSIILQLRDTFAKLAAVDTLQMSLQFEPPLTGVWPRNHYILLTTLSRELVHVIPFMYSLISTLQNTDRMPELLNRLGWSNPRILSGIYSVLYMAARAIASSEPLPAVTPGRLSEEYYLHLHQVVLKRPDITDPHLSKEHMIDHDDRWILAGMKMAELVYERLDGIMILIKGLVGEYHDTDSRLFDWNIEQGIDTPHSIR